MNSIITSVTRFECGVGQQKEERVVEEEPLQVTINGKTFAVAMRTPGDDIHLVRGLLFTEGIISLDGLQASSCALQLERKEAATVVDVSIPEVYLCKDLYQKRALLVSSACGFCGKRELGDIELDGDRLCLHRPFERALLPAMYEKLAHGQHLFRQTGGCHAAGVFTLEGDLLQLFEDVGRHNAVDKCVGWLIGEDRVAEAAVLLVSGRISFEIVAKAYRAALPVLAGVSAPTSMAVRKARALGISLFGFCRDQRCTLYSGPEDTAGRPDASCSIPPTSSAP